MKRMVFSGVVALIGWSLASLSYAASLQMYPVTVNFCNGETARPVYIKNTGLAPIGTQLRLYQWQQRDHKDVLTPTQAVISSPPIASIPPGKQQLVRLIAPAGTRGPEQSYRLIMDELPGEEQAKSQDNQVRFLLRYSVPVFFSCPDAKTNLNNIRVTLDASGPAPRLIIRNNNTQHIKLSNVALLSRGKNITITKGLMGYVLPNSEMSWFLPRALNTGTSLSMTINDNETNKTINISN